MYLSIVVLNYFASEKIEELVNSIKEQNFSGELVIVDNSEDEQEFKKLKCCEDILTDNPCRVICSDRNAGFSYGTNIGIKSVSSECTHVYILNPDTVLKPGSLSYLSDLLKVLPDVVISPRGIRMEDGQDWSFGGNLHYLRGRCDVDSTFKKYSLSSDFGTCASVVVPYAFLNKYGLLDEDFFLGGEEWELSVRLRRSGATILTPSRIIYEHEISGTHKKYGLPFIYMGQRTKVLFMRKCFPKSFVFWLILYIPVAPILVLRYCIQHKTPVVKSFILSIKAVFRSIMKTKITKEEFFSIGDIK
ncbi:glycosyltransferase family 2 protein [Vibrio fluvialis]|uniref:glycosyltransferase family 2 protein n=1 Tax=Vibrio fluvialis TaxID=676 RepID=UPI001F41ED65|nr:glycosyltransferase [Vibrio fluvialis]MCE7641500.1 glycosyltransferase [Vibrio fluvialis]